MKRNSMNSYRQFNPVNEEEVKARLKHQNLLEEYLELQKEHVSKKKKLKMWNQKREDLLAEVRFLRQRYSYLSMIKSQEYERKEDSVLPQNQYLQSKSFVNDNGINEVHKNPCSLPNVDPNAGNEKKDGRSELHVQSSLRKDKKTKNHLINGKKVGKKKISWKDEVTLKV